MSGDIAKQIKLARQQSIGDLPRRSARRYPDRIAIRCGQVSWTYAQFDALCNRLGRGLIAKGIAPGDRVAILSRNSHAFGAMRFALARIGAVLVPINFMLNADEIGFILRSSGARVLAVGPDFAAVAAEAIKRDTHVTWSIALPGEDVPAQADAGVAFESTVARRRVAARDRYRRHCTGADRLHQRHRVPAQRCHAHTQRCHVAVYELHH